MVSTKAFGIKGHKNIEPILAPSQIQKFANVSYVGQFFPKSGLQTFYGPLA